MIDVKDAAKTAFNYFQELFQGKFYNLALEEVELSDDGKYWLITIGYDPPTTGIATLTGANDKREYKLLKIESDGGRVVAMKIRNIR